MTWDGGSIPCKIFTIITVKSDMGLWKYTMPDFYNNYCKI